jgi:hypothetical protein
MAVISGCTGHDYSSGMLISPSFRVINVETVVLDTSAIITIAIPVPSQSPASRCKVS